MYEVPWENAAGGEVQGKAPGGKELVERTIMAMGQEVRVVGGKGGGGRRGRAAQ